MDFQSHVEDLRAAEIEPLPFRAYNANTFEQIPQLKFLTEEQRFAVRVVAQVLPFRVNQYVVNQLIDWDDAPDDPIFRLVFPQPEMLAPEHFSRIANLLKSGAEESGGTSRRRRDSSRAESAPGWPKNEECPANWQ